MIILDRNLFEIPPEDISETQVLPTVVSGREVGDGFKIRP